MSRTEQIIADMESLSRSAPPDAMKTIQDSIASIEASFDAKSTIQVGDTIPEFRLPNAVGKELSRADLVNKGPLLIVLYRGEWCPFCNLALLGLQKHLGDFIAKGVTVVAISPELPNQSLTTVEKNELKFQVLSDVGNQFAKKLGLVWKQPETLRPLFEQLGFDLKARNGDDSFEVPIPATLLVDSKGIVRNTYINPNYMKRLEPEVALGWVDELGDGCI
jgi:peroxiredoxin